MIIRAKGKQDDREGDAEGMREGERQRVRKRELSFVFVYEI